MSIKRSTSLITAFFISLALLITGCSASQDEKSGGSSNELRVAISLGDASGLDIAHEFADAQLLIVPLWGDTLIHSDSKDPTKLEPGLAKSWEANADATEYTVVLRDDVKFSTGKTMTADDVKFTVDRSRYIEGSPSSLLTNIKEVTVVDDHTVKFILNLSDSSFPAVLGIVYISPMDSAEAKKHGAVAEQGAATSDTAQEWLNANTIGTGPYMLESWDKNQKMTFKRNPNYYGDPPAYDKVTLVDVRSSATQSQLVSKGDVDIALDIDPDAAKSMGDGVKVLSDPSYNLIYMFLNNKNPAAPQLADPRVRQAIQHAINYDEIGQGLAGGAKRPAAVVPLGFQGSDAVKPATYDPNKAKSLLAEAGVTSMSLDVTFANMVLYGISLKTLWEKVSEDLSKVGITLNLLPVEYDAWLAKMQKGELTMSSSLWAPDYFDSATYFDVFGRNDGLVGKRAGINLPQNQGIFDQYLATTDKSKREDLATKLITNMRDDASLIPFVQPNKIIVHGTNITGVAYSPTQVLTIREIKPA
ncbi:ABC transporter substrate-binding protein [Cumulibacter manganitolerans]|uniref:ABC transporter substrate-binding protein n=1 Tax=Cumulibacter manganitolerans TaxID=1884992 RepID=UPI0012956D4C|nr:ABC transporter substrate-binding protein [Cumulibacter manganitolerans]